jgi:hypothetical protein
VDALDECLEGIWEYLIERLQSLGDAVHLLVTSRHLPLIEGLFLGKASLEIKALDDDIRAYIEDRILHAHRLKLHLRDNEDLHEIILNKVVTSTRGM